MSNEQRCENFTERARQCSSNTHGVVSTRTCMASASALPGATLKCRIQTIQFKLSESSLASGTPPSLNISALLHMAASLHHGLGTGTMTRVISPLTVGDADAIAMRVSHRQMAALGLMNSVGTTMVSWNLREENTVLQHATRELFQNVSLGLG